MHRHTSTSTSSNSSRRAPFTDTQNLNNTLSARPSVRLSSTYQDHLSGTNVKSLVFGGTSGAAAAAATGHDDAAADLNEKRREMPASPAPKAAPAEVSKETKYSRRANAKHGHSHHHRDQKENRQVPPPPPLPPAASSYYYHQYHQPQPSLQTPHLLSTAYANDANHQRRVQNIMQEWEEKAAARAAAGNK